MIKEDTSACTETTLSSKISLVLQLPEKSYTRNYHTCGNAAELETFVMCTKTNRAQSKEYCDNCPYINLN